MLIIALAIGLAFALGVVVGLLMNAPVIPAHPLDDPLPAPRVVAAPHEPHMRVADNGRAYLENDP